MNPRLNQLLAAGDWQAFPAYFDGLSVAQFRSAGPELARLMGERLAADEYWQLTAVMVRCNARAFLVTLLKGAMAANVATEGEAFRAFCQGISGNPIDVEKTFRCLLPRYDSPQSVGVLLDLLGVEEPKQRVRLLIRQDSDAACYALFHTLKFLENDRDFLLRAVKFLIQKRDDRSFNFASLLTAYFGLGEVKAIFSLRIEPYQLAWLEGSYDAFCRALRR